MKFTFVYFRCFPDLGATTDYVNGAGYIALLSNKQQIRTDPANPQGWKTNQKRVL